VQEADQLKRRILDLKVEIQNEKQKKVKRAQFEKMTVNLDKAERQLYILSVKHERQEAELNELRQDNLRLSAQVKSLSDNLKVQIDHKNEF